MEVTVQEIKTHELYDVTVPTTATGGDLKQAVATAHGLELDGMRLVWQGKFVADSEALSAVGLGEHMVVQAYIRGFTQCRRRRSRHRLPRPPRTGPIRAGS